MQASRLEKVDFIVFDLDGTLVDSRRDIAASICVGLEAVGAPGVSHDRIYPLIGLPLVQMFDQLLPPAVSDHVESAAEAYRQHYYDHCADQSTLFSGVSECLAGLSHIPLAVATTKMTFMAVRVAERLGLTNFFDYIQGCDGIPHKPDPAVLRIVAEKLGVSLESGLMVGDTVMDVAAGKAVSMKTCAVTYGIGKKDDLRSQEPDLLLDSLADLPGALCDLEM